MKYLTRFLSVFLCLPLLFVAFSFTASAESSQQYDIDGTAELHHGHIGNVISEYSFTYPTEEQFPAFSLPSSINSTTNILTNFNFANSDGTNIIKGDKEVKLTISNVYQGISWMQGGKHYGIVFENLDTAELILCNSDGTYEYLPISFTYVSAITAMEFSANFSTSKDVRKIILRTIYNPTNRLGLTGSSVSDLVYYGVNLAEGLALDLTIETEEVGWLKKIAGGITDLWETAESGFANIVKGITELPQKIWTFIEDGLKNLFVPDDQYMASYSDKWSELLSSRLGAVYDVVDIVAESWDGVMHADQTDTINIPLVTIPLGSSSFSFGGQDVKIVPDGFSDLVVALKAIVGIVCTYSFINGLLKRYDEVMGVEK